MLASDSAAAPEDTLTMWAAAAFDHARQQSANEAHRRNEVALEVLYQRRVCHRHRRHWRCQCGVVDDDVDRSELSFGGVSTIV